MEKKRIYKTALHRYLLVMAFFLFAASQTFSQQLAIPDLWGHRIVDEAQILSQATFDQLEQVLKAHEDSTTNQIAVLIIPTLQGEALEEYSLRVAEKWKLGQKKNDNGVLLFIAVDDHKMRIEVGQGLEGVLTDAICSRIIRNEIAPNFRQDNYDEGIRAGISAIIGTIRGEYSAQADGDNSLQNTDLTISERIFTGLFIFGILGVFTFIGLFVPGCSGWFLYAFLIPFYAIFPAVVVGITGGLSLLAVYIVAFPIFKILLGRTTWGKTLTTKMKNRSGGGFGSGWSSGSGWSGGSSGGGFSGGGGSFGGGGSSGSW